MANLCKCGCGEQAMKSRFYARGHKPKNGTTVAGGGKSRVTRGVANGHFRVELTAEGLDAVWHALPAGKKAELLKGL